MVFGLELPVFLIWVSAITFLVGFLIVLKRYLEDRTKLVKIFLLWLLAMSIGHFFIGIDQVWKVPTLVPLAFLTFLLITAYIIKLPLFVAKPEYENKGFYAALLVSLLIALIYFYDFSLMKTLTFIYMIILIAIAGGYILWAGYKERDKALRIKSIGGGSGIISCCVVADAFIVIPPLGLLTVLLHNFFALLAPVLIVVGILYGRYLAKK